MRERKKRKEKNPKSKKQTGIFCGDRFWPGRS